jgi:hypothetical protein
MQYKAFLNGLRVFVVSISLLGETWNIMSIGMPFYLWNLPFSSNY